jgi:hypothetical protein
MKMDESQYFSIGFLFYDTVYFLVINPQIFAYYPIVLQQILVVIQQSGRAAANHKSNKAYK